MNKQRQKDTLIDIMNADAKDGLYDHSVDSTKMVTAVEWLIEQLKGYEYDYKDFTFHGVITSDLVEQAKQMQKEQIKNAYNIGKVEANFPPEMLTNGEKFYTETYGN